MRLTKKRSTTDHEDMRPLRYLRNELLPALERKPARVLAWQGTSMLASGLLGIGALALFAASPDTATRTISGALVCTSFILGGLSFWGAWFVISRSVHGLHTEVEASQLTLATALDGIRMDAVVERSEDWNLELRDAISRLEDEHRCLHATLSAERLQGSFVRDLAEALEIADTEVEVFQTAERAAKLAVRGAFQLIAASEGRMVWEVSTEEAACRCESARTCPAMRKGRTMRFSPGSGLARCNQLVDDDAHAVCTPVAAAGQTIAVAQASWVGPERPQQIASLEALATQLGARLGVVRTLQEREVQASTDALTGLANRRCMNELGRELEDRDGEYAVIACDLDHFKRLNDTWGHELGDRCLKLFSRVLEEVCRSSDRPCRPGGEEFTVILPASNALNAIRVAERIRDRLAQAVAGTAAPFTVSMGVAGSEHGGSFEEVLCLADTALYAAKEAGRDRVRLHGALSEVTRDIEAA